MIAAIAKYWPLVAAGAHLLDVVVNAKWDQLQVALELFAGAGAASFSLRSAHNSGPSK
jgi:hypothetical protein